jgi:type I restriction enzyme S subunit
MSKGIDARGSLLPNQDDDASGDLPPGWATTKVGVVSSAIQYGYTASAVAHPSGPRFLRITDIQDGKVNWATVPTCEIGQQDLEKFRLSDGDIVFARTGATTGKSYLIRSCPEAVFASYLIRLKPKQVVMPELLSSFFQTAEYWQSISENVAGNAQPNCNASKLGEIELPLPPIAEQRRIVAALEAILAKVANCQARLANVPTILKRFRQSVLAAARSGRLTADWRTSRGIESNGVKYPATWNSTNIEGVAECLDRIRKPVNREARATRVGSVPYYGANGQVGWIDQHLFDEELVLVVEDESFVGRTKPFSYVIRGKSWVNNHAHVLRPKSGMPADYLNIHLAYYNFAPLTSGTTGRRKLTKKSLMDARLTVAPLDEQLEIVRRVDALIAVADQIEARYQKVCQHVDRITQSVLAKAFRGELVPSEHALAAAEARTYEPASALLERIKSATISNCNAAAKKPRRAKN